MSAHSVYSDDYLDYAFTLKRDDLAAIRKKAQREFKHLVSDDVDDNLVAEKGLYHYESELFRKNGRLIAATEGSGDTKSGNVIPNRSVLYCNNIKNYASTICDTSMISGTGEVE